ncbi:hypothetical protein D3C86_1351140 [compost metagenome]
MKIISLQNLKTKFQKLNQKPIFASILLNHQNIITMSEQQNQDQGINIELTDEQANGTYSNLAIITHSYSEFVMDFISVMPGMPKAKVNSRIVMTPHNAKRLMRALIDNIKRYETQNGLIKDEQEGGVPMNLGGTTGEA